MKYCSANTGLEYATHASVFSDRQTHNLQLVLSIFMSIKGVSAAPTAFGG